MTDTENCTSVVMINSEKGYVNNWEPGFVFVADEAQPAVWRLDSDGNLLTENYLSVEGVGQLAKIRRDISNGFIACSTAWGFLEGEDVNVAALVKLSDDLTTEWVQVTGQMNIQVLYPLKMLKETDFIEFAVFRTV